MLSPARRAGREIGAVEFVEAGAPQPELGAGIGAGEFSMTEAAEHVADKRSGMKGVELAGVFIPGT